ncbi:MAG: tRNA (guanosine(46)-N7)-methyltransferase TrmB [Candidatus Marinimicrobia bacterium]|nr:tRNA (guanosine(46)-N7)-methyltransferase TrmB [Candidatus Neomarinimicrobiota bacterium]MCF7880259.1 tRNA (guanosine(46)-N7)-methyltransferase TrmB [Candidatus Neomarinimicrobiota bacterium]
MNDGFPFQKQPLLELKDEDKINEARRMKHPHGWSREIRPLHDVDTFLSPEVLKTKPLYLEIGCGHGNFMEKRASEDPDGHYIGIENVHLFAVTAAERIEKAGLTNVLIINQDANVVLEQVFPPESLDKIFIMYPDPWPKNRHEKRRLIRESTYERYHDVLKPGGLINIWTDAPKWVELSFPWLEELPGEITKEEVSDEISKQRTLFERKAKSKQHQIFHITYTKST